MKHWKLENWCFEAVEKIKYRPDRDAVYAELLQHLDDRCESFLAQGMSKEIAVIRTVEAMGDPSELAEQLAAIHRPFWAFAYSISKWLLYIVALIAAFMISTTIPKYVDSMQTARSDSWYAQSADPAQTRVMYTEPNCSASSDGYTFTVTRAAIQQRTYESSDGISYKDTYLALELKVSNYIPWSKSFQGIGAIWGKDDLGNIYYSGLYPVTTMQHMRYGSNGSDVFTQFYVFQIDLNDPEALSWFELHYDRDGRDVVLRIDLTREGEG